MTHWLAQIPYMPAWTGWSTVANLANGELEW